MQLYEAREKLLSENYDRSGKSCFFLFISSKADANKCQIIYSVSFQIIFQQADSVDFFLQSISIFTHKMLILTLFLTLPWYFVKWLMRILCLHLVWALGCEHPCVSNWFVSASASMISISLGRVLTAYLAHNCHLHWQTSYLLLRRNYLIFFLSHTQTTR